VTRIRDAAEDVGVSAAYGLNEGQDELRQALIEEMQELYEADTIDKG
jgi:aspartate/methionine/tyrosine aminotransferase